MFYGRDVAHSHDTGHADFARGAARWLVAVLEPPGTVVELGCGSGISSRALADAGFDVVGVDLSGALLEIARERVPEAGFVEASFLDFPLPTGVAAVTALGEVFNYLADARVARASLAALFERVHAALRPGGLLAFDVLEPGTAGSAGPVRSWVEGEDWLLCVQRSEAGSSLVREIVVFRRDGDAWRRSEERHEVLLMPRADVSADLERAGFEVEVLERYGEMGFRPGLVGFAARKSS
jgi:SAM-dependent methyltransferase